MRTRTYKIERDCELILRRNDDKWKRTTQYLRWKEEGKKKHIYEEVYDEQNAGRDNRPDHFCLVTFVRPFVVVCAGAGLGFSRLKRSTWGSGADTKLIKDPFQPAKKDNKCAP
jgi:hypothetical protein